MLRTRLAPLALVMAAGCGAGSSQVRTIPFPSELGSVFDDAVDYAATFEGLGHYAQDYRTQLDALTRNADIVATARVETVVLSDAEGLRNYRLGVHVDAPIKGPSPTGDRVSLHVNEGDVGFNSVRGRERRLQPSGDAPARWLVFVRWYTDGAGRTQAHWHLTPYSDSTAAHVRTLLHDDDQNARRIIVGS